MDTLLNLNWASTEVVYIGGYLLVITVSLLTMVTAKRAAQIQDLKQARVAFMSADDDTPAKTIPFPLVPSGLKSALGRKVPVAKPSRADINRTAA